MAESDRYVTGLDSTRDFLQSTELESHLEFDQNFGQLHHLRGCGGLAAGETAL